MKPKYINKIIIKDILNSRYDNSKNSYIVDSFFTKSGILHTFKGSKNDLILKSKDTHYIVSDNNPKSQCGVFSNVRITTKEAYEKYINENAELFVLLLN